MNIIFNIAIALFVFISVFCFMQTLDETERGEGGFGSTGKN